MIDKKTPRTLVSPLAHATFHARTLLRVTKLILEENVEAYIPEIKK